MTYEENLRKTAEEISVVIFNCQYSRMTTNSKQECTELAEYCLKKQAETYKVAYFDIIDVFTDISRDEIDDSKINGSLKQLGLIP